MSLFYRMSFARVVLLLQETRLLIYYILPLRVSLLAMYRLILELRKERRLSCVIECARGCGLR